jgi:hypothetical protein
MAQYQDTKQLTEQLLAATFHGSIQLDAGSPIANRDHVFRFTVVDGPATAPASVIVKRAREWGTPSVHRG